MVRRQSIATKKGANKKMQTVTAEPITDRFVMVNGIWRMKSSYKAATQSKPTAWDEFKSFGKSVKEVITAPISIVTNAQKGLFGLADKALDRGSQTIQSLGQSLSLPLIVGGGALLAFLAFKK